MAAAAEELPFHLRGNYAPVEREVSADELEVQGTIPPELRGLYLRNGPNPREPTRHWFVGAGMIHGIRLDGGRAVWYRNRWVRGKAFTEGANFIDEEGRVDYHAGAANTNVVGHAGRILALVESSFPHCLTPDLETVGPFDFDGRLDSAMTAHPKLCPVSGEMHFFGYGFSPEVAYHRVDAGGKLVQSERIAVPGPTMMHDFAITERHVIFMDLPIVFTPEALADGGMPYQWSDDYGARLGVMERGARGESVRWFDIEPCYVFHPMNAFEREGRIVLDVARYPELWRDGADRFARSYPHRFEIDPAAGRVSESGLDDRTMEFPRVDPRREGLPNRYGYGVTDKVDEEEAGNGPGSLIKFDLQTGESRVHDFGAGRHPGEAVFVPASPKAGEDEGWVMTYVHDATRSTSEFVILDAQRFDAAPVARVALPQRVPYGFHGNWIADPA